MRLIAFAVSRYTDLVIDTQSQTAAQKTHSHLGPQTPSNSGERHPLPTTHHPPSLLCPGFLTSSLHLWTVFLELASSPLFFPVLVMCEVVSSLLPRVTNLWALSWLGPWLWPSLSSAHHRRSRISILPISPTWAFTGSHQYIRSRTSRWQYGVRAPFFFSSCTSLCLWPCYLEDSKCATFLRLPFQLCLPWRGGWGMPYLLSLLWWLLILRFLMAITRYFTGGQVIDTWLHILSVPL